MSRNRAPAAAASGPDWVDISTFLNALYDLHQATVKIELVVGPGQYVGAMTVRITATSPRLVSAGRSWSYYLVDAFPSHRHKTLEGLVYHMLHRVDHQATKELWEQAYFA